MQSFLLRVQVAQTLGLREASEAEAQLEKARSQGHLETLRIPEARS